MPAEFIVVPAGAVPGKQSAKFLKYPIYKYIQEPAIQPTARAEKQDQAPSRRVAAYRVPSPLFPFAGDRDESPTETYLTQTAGERGLSRR